MRSPRRKPSVLARFAAPLLLSVGLHGLLVLGLWQVPAYQPAPLANRDPTRAEDEAPLGLDDAPPRPKPRAPAPVLQASFDVRLVEAPRPSAPALLPPNVLAVPGVGAVGGKEASGSAPGGGGNAAGAGGDPCALEVGKAARSVVYVVDRSMSMGFHGGLARARREVLASLKRLTPAVSFQVIAYNRTAEPLAIDGRAGLLPADENTLRQVADAVSALRAGGGTDHGRALRRALAFHPDLLYFLTDADDVSLDDVRAVTRLNDRRSVIHTIELSGGREARPEGPLRKLAADNGGTYRRLDPEE